MKNNLNKYRKSLGFTLDQVSKISGTSKSYVWEIEKGNCEPSIKIAYAISSAVGQEVQTVFPDPNEYYDNDYAFVRSTVKHGK